jgi:phosphatidylglycerophosphatase A
MRWNISAVAQTSAARTAWAWQIATLFHIGFLKPGPGTWGAAATLLVYVAVAFRAPAYAQLIAVTICLIAVAGGIPAATLVAREAGQKDPGFVVIDEVAGQALTMIAAPFAWKYALTGFVLFRLFDIWKPPPIRLLERLPEGTGIVVDDLGAGLYAALVLFAMVRLHLL